jgi:fructose-1,6-bisphosphatase II
MMLPTKGVREPSHSPKDVEALTESLARFSSPTTELIQASVDAAVAAMPLVGSGDKMAVDRAAVDAMRASFNSFEFGGIVVIGEGAKDEAPMLFNGEVLGRGPKLEWDIAVDPIDGTRLAAEGIPGAVAVVAATTLDTMMNCPDVYFMKKLVCGSAGIGVVDIERSATENISALATALGKPVSELAVAVIYKKMNFDLIAEVEATGAKWHRFDEGDVAIAVAAATPGSGIDMMVGIGGNPEGVLAASAVRVLGGFMQGVLAPRNDQEVASAIACGYSPDQKLELDDLVGPGRQVFVLAGVTPGILADAVRDGGAGKHGKVVEVFVLDSLIEGAQKISVER